MGATSDIVATWRGPGRVARRLLGQGAREGRALVFLMAGCALVFVAQWPRLARDAQLNGTDLNPALGGALLGWLFIMPLVFYGLAALSALILRAAGLRVGGYGARLALFWALLAASPAMLLFGLVTGFIGPGAARSVTGALWLAAFAWFWAGGLRAAAQQARA